MFERRNEWISAGSICLLRCQGHLSTTRNSFSNEIQYPARDGLQTEIFSYNLSLLHFLFHRNLIDRRIALRWNQKADHSSVQNLSQKGVHFLDAYKLGPEVRTPYVTIAGYIKVCDCQPATLCSWVMGCNVFGCLLRSKCICVYFLIFWLGRLWLHKNQRL